MNNYNIIEKEKETLQELHETLQKHKKQIELIKQQVNEQEKIVEEQEQIELTKFYTKICAKCSTTYDSREIENHCYICGLKNYCSTCEKSEVLVCKREKYCECRPCDKGDRKYPIHIYFIVCKSCLLNNKNQIILFLLNGGLCDELNVRCGSKFYYKVEEALS